MSRYLFSLKHITKNSILSNQKKIEPNILSFKTTKNSTKKYIHSLKNSVFLLY